MDIRLFTIPWANTHKRKIEKGRREENYNTMGYYHGLSIPWAI